MEAGSSGPEAKVKVPAPPGTCSCGLGEASPSAPASVASCVRGRGLPLDCPFLLCSPPLHGWERNLHAQCVCACAHARLGGAASPLRGKGALSGQVSLSWLGAGREGQAGWQGGWGPSCVSLCVESGRPGAGSRVTQVAGLAHQKKKKITRLGEGQSSSETQLRTHSEPILLGS